MIDMKEVRKLCLCSELDYGAFSVICCDLPALVIECGNNDSESRREHLGYVRPVEFINAQQPSIKGVSALNSSNPFFVKY